MIVGKIRPHPRDVRRGSKLQPARRILMALKREMRQPYLSVTFNAVVSPEFTVALALTPAKPGAATVTV